MRTKRRVSPQRLWQRRMYRRRRCIICGQPWDHYKGYCDSHALDRCVRQRERNGYGSYEKHSSKGRPPKILDKLVRLGA